MRRVKVSRCCRGTNTAPHRIAAWLRLETRCRLRADGCRVPPASHASLLQYRGCAGWKSDLLAWPAVGISLVGSLHIRAARVVGAAAAGASARAVIVVRTALVASSQNERRSGEQ